MNISYQRTLPKNEHKFLDVSLRMLIAAIFAAMVIAGRLLIFLLTIPFYIAITTARLAMAASAATLFLEDEE